VVPKIFWARIVARVRAILINLIFLPKFPEIDTTFRIVSYGSNYGRKSFCAELIPSNPLLVSGGVGEDISFDIEFLNTFGGNAFYSTLPQQPSNIFV
jgi:hypothetical protein